MESEYTQLETAALRDRVKELEGENEILKHWKKEMMDLTRPIFEWGQSKESGWEPGASIFDEVIRRVRAYKSLELEVERLTIKIESAKDRCANEMSNFIPVKDILKALTSENQK